MQQAFTARQQRERIKTNSQENISSFSKGGSPKSVADLPNTVKFSVEVALVFKSYSSFVVVVCTSIKPNQRLRLSDTQEPEAAAAQASGERHRGDTERLLMSEAPGRTSSVTSDKLPSSGVTCDAL